MVHWKIVLLCCGQRFTLYLSLHIQLFMSPSGEVMTSSLEINPVFHCIILGTLCGIFLTPPGKSQTTPGDDG